MRGNYNRSCARSHGLQRRCTVQLSSGGTLRPNSWHTHAPKAKPIIQSKDQVYMVDSGASLHLMGESSLASQTYRGDPISTSCRAEWRTFCSLCQCLGVCFSSAYSRKARQLHRARRAGTPTVAAFALSPINDGLQLRGEGCDARKFSCFKGNRSVKKTENHLDIQTANGVVRSTKEATAHTQKFGTVLYVKLVEGYPSVLSDTIVR